VTRPERPIDICLQEVRNSDILVVIVGRKYGSIVPGCGISYSEAECRGAQRLKLPSLVYFLDEGKSVASERSKDDLDSLRKLKKRKADLKENHTVYSFKNSRELALQVAAALGREIGECTKTAQKSPRRASARSSTAYAKLANRACTP
jgi:Domain of unknown function (DUF4062)